MYATIVRSLQEGSRSLKAVQKLLMNAVEERDFSVYKHVIVSINVTVSYPQTRVCWCWSNTAH